MKEAARLDTPETLFKNDNLWCSFSSLGESRIRLYGTVLEK